MTVPSTDIRQIITNQGQDLQTMSSERPVLLVFLRHLGCIFCQEALRDLAELKSEFEKRSVTLCLVHMGTEDDAKGHFAGSTLSQVARISDPECDLYSSFGLIKMRNSQLLGLHMWLRTAQATVRGSNPFARQIGDGFQMPGVFLIRDGQIVREYIHEKPSDRPDYLELID